MTSCVHSEQPENFFYGELEMVRGEVFHCGGGDYPVTPNASSCYTWSRKDQDWVQTDLTTNIRPLKDADSVLVPSFGWWMISGLNDEDNPNNENDLETEYLPFDDRTAFIEVSRVSLPRCRLITLVLRVRRCRCTTTTTARSKSTLTRPSSWVEKVARPPRPTTTSRSTTGSRTIGW